MKSIGYSFLIDHFDLKVCDLLCKSYLSDASQSRVVESDGAIAHYYSASRISVGETWQDQLIFAIKHEGINLEVLKAFFAVCEKSALTALIRSVPTGTYHRRLWFIYEWLTEDLLDIDDLTMGNYITAVDERLQLTLSKAHAKRVRRQRVLNNLIGSRRFCPFVRKVSVPDNLSSVFLKNRANELLSHYSPDLLYRAVQYLYVKETRSSFAIERVTPSQRRMDDFVAVLKDVATVPLTKERLADIQNRVVDARYAQRDWRTTQVYVGETLTPTHEKVHFVAAKPEDVPSLMEGFLACLEALLRDAQADPVVSAAVLSFAFVFIHPFEDGNGRLHRYLMHYILSRTGFSPTGLIFPVSAVLLKKPQEYDRMLEDFSRRLMARLSYTLSSEGEVRVQGASADFYRYVDFTAIVTKFRSVIYETIETEWKYELDYLLRYDRIRAAMRDVVDLPEAKANQLILFVNQNNGVLSKAKRDKFPELTDDEIGHLEAIVRQESVDR